MIVLLLLSREYLILMLIALAIAIPISNYFITEWLRSFAFSNSVNVVVFIIPATILVVVSLTIVMGQSYRATKINPADTLRSE